ncbi:hypothetical protein GM708_06580 [Vibrio cholerae]|nr:hypothetical protein [Vibrio cholerae]
MEAYELILAGGAGGAVVGVGRLLYLLHDITSDTPRYGQAVVVQLVATVILAVLGAAFAYFLDGKSGAFIQGITALSMLLLLGGNLLERHPAGGSDRGGTTG